VVQSGGFLPLKPISSLSEIVDHPPRWKKSREAADRKAGSIARLFFRKASLKTVVEWV
jgi:hypothetical protein